MNNTSTYGSDKNDSYDHILMYIEEAVDARSELIKMATRAIQAYKGYPSRDGYVQSIERYADLMGKDDSERMAAIKSRCKEIRPRKSMVISKAIDSMVAQAMGGVGQYECSPYDPHFVKSPELIDALNEGAMNFYADNHFDAVIAPMLEYAGLTGSAYLYLGHRLDKRKDNGQIDAQVIPSTEMLIDPLRSKRNRDRFIGFQQSESWQNLKSKLIKKQHSDIPFLESINKVDTQLLAVEAAVNKDISGFSKSATFESLPAALSAFYRSDASNWYESNKEYLKNKRSLADEDANRYRADDVEVSYVYDLEEGAKYTVVNRTFIVDRSTDYLTGKVPYEYPVVDPYSGETKMETSDKVVSIDHPFVALEYKRSLWEIFPYSPIVDVLDIFDDICALESLIYHTVSIMTPITFTGNPKDIEKLGAIAGVSGETIKGFISNSVTVLNKAVDLTPALAQIQRLEATISNKLNGMDVQEQSKMVGDRATAAEAMGVASLVSQGLNSLLANLERFAEEMMTKAMKMMVIYADDDYVYSFGSGEGLQTLSRYDLAGDLKIRAKLKSKIKAEQQSQINSTMQWFVPLMSSEAIKNKEAFAQSIIPTLAQGFSRRTISSWFKASEREEQLMKAQLDAAMKQQEAAVKQQQAAEGIDMAYVDPTGGGSIGMADISGALGGNAPIGAPEDWSMEPSPLGGPNKPSPSSRQLGYGIGSAEIPAPTSVPTDNGDAVSEAAMQLAISGQDQVSPMMTPTAGGMMANNPFAAPGLEFDQNSKFNNNYRAGAM